MRCRFADLNLRLERAGGGREPSVTGATMDLLRRAAEFGYDTVALNLDFGPLVPPQSAADGEQQRAGKRKRRGNVGANMSLVPKPVAIDSDAVPRGEDGRRINVLRRLTVTVDDDASIALLSVFSRLPAVQQYDLVAVKTHSEAVLSTLATKGQVIDMVTFDPSVKVPWLYKGKTLRRALDLCDLTVELVYACALSDQSSRRQWMCNGRQLASQCERSRAAAHALLAASGAASVLQLRPPYDVANMAALFGAAPEHGRRMVGNNCDRLIRRAMSRRCTAGGAVLIRPVAQVSDEQLAMLAKVPEFEEQLKRTAHADGNDALTKQLRIA